MTNYHFFYVSQVYIFLEFTPITTIAAKSMQNPHNKALGLGNGDTVILDDPTT